MVEHGSGQEEGQIQIHVIARQQRLNGGQSSGVVVNREIGRQEGSKLNQRILALQINATSYYHAAFERKVRK